YAVSGVNGPEVYEVGQKLMAKMMQYPGFQSVSSDYYAHTPNLDVELHRDQAKTYGVSEARILSLLRSAYSQNYVYLVKKPQDQYQVILEMEDSARANPDDLSKLYIRSDNGQRLVPLGELVTWKQTLGPQAVNHLNQFTSMTLFFNLKPGVAVFVMYVILAILYESYVHPLTVLSTLPTALVGGLLTLFVFGQEASLYAFVGMFMLMGIVKKNGIMIVDFARARVEAGEQADKAIHDASMDRFRPILMTTLAAVFGAMPIALGYGADGSSRRPLGLVVVGGLIVSQFITLYITPVIYLYLEQFQEKVLDRTKFFGKRHVEVPATANPSEPTG